MAREFMTDEMVDEEILRLQSSPHVKLDRGKDEIECVTNCNHVLTKGILALLEHGINGNNIH